MSARKRMISSTRLMNSGLKNVIGSPGRLLVMIEHGVREVDRAALAVGQATVVQHLQQDVEHVGVRLLDLVQQHHAVGPAANGLRELTALVVPDVAGRRADQSGHGVLLHVLAHVDAHHRPLVVEQELGQRPGQLGLADAGRAEEHERPDRPVGVRQAGPAAPDGVGDRRTASSWPMTRRCRSSSRWTSLSISPSISAADRDAGRLGDHLGDVLGVDLLLEHPAAGLQLVQVLGGVDDAPLQLRDAPVADLGRLLQVRLALELGAQPLQLLLQRADDADGLPLGLPVLLHLAGLRLELRQLLVEHGQALLRRGVGLLGQRHPLDLELQDAPVHHVDLGGERVDLDAQLRRRPRPPGRWPCRAGTGW